MATSRSFCYNPLPIDIPNTEKNSHLKIFHKKLYFSVSIDNIIILIK